MYSVIVFDLGNVILSFDYSKVINHFNGIKPGLGDKFSKLYTENYDFHRSFEKGNVTKEKFLSVMTEWLEHSVTADEFCRVFSSIFTLSDHVQQLLPILKEKYTLCLLSNTNEIHEEYGYRHYDFLNHFGKIFLSHKIGAIKPEKEIYKAVEAFTKKPSHEHFFIDDIAEYVEGAKSCGWDAVQFVNFEKLIDDLRNRKIL
ncbi:MAG: HAD family phosphatase [Bacteroidota bacterium]